MKGMMKWRKRDLRELVKVKKAPDWLIHLSDYLHMRPDFTPHRLFEGDHCRVTCWIRAWLRERGVEVQYEPVAENDKYPWTRRNHGDLVGVSGSERDALLAAVRDQLAKEGGK